MQMPRSTDAMARALGLGVFLLGVVILLFVFATAFRDLAAAGVLGQLGAPGREARADWWGLAVKGVFLLIMLVAGAVVANRGIGLYGAARGTDEG
ncbi:MAG: hypothetical protein QN174_04600 [Armatimonadota bacterium]|nr:hypothetical protein [Armatimonadota bacterium]MDR7421339.1 hypothetical protein [Armatimonadota bacterium]MDR7455231.1 hypothetical protein [Armatimonadota bacterium]MDR7456511.1 hypothetical protein [Armatimonadota bacterium]MDR7496222.1 hypothetical protein [Armatimonadota bacterium]